MLELTHGRKSDERVSSRNPNVRASVAGSIWTARCSLSIVQSTFDYWQLRVLTAMRRKRGANFLERSEHAETLEADCKLRSVDAMRGLRERATDLLNPANSV